MSGPHISYWSMVGWSVVSGRWSVGRWSVVVGQLAGSFKKTPLYAYNKNLETVISNIRHDFFILSNWFYGNYMVLNPGKCLFILFGIKENK